MTELTRRTALERLIGKPRPWVVWAWAALATVWIIFAIIDPSGFHTFMAISWSVLAAIQLGAAYYARRQERRRVQAAEVHTITH
ncbi:hypothetical protein DEJ17_04575 [Curtobacterium sp. MCSS17_011]|uniref:hypothetical protein n=1 Tax=Curtobacterium sp. MCSS17_011 TaxID=2175643 RepID=UPI000D811636|nr:hypothetical protein [Curtobacterium sp. MCSS17_011]PYY61396.1 hypothetical protein DEJ17_04575 [Curtobacterium sp. MCSS17_011]